MKLHKAPRFRVTRAFWFLFCYCSRILSIHVGSCVCERRFGLSRLITALRRLPLALSAKKEKRKEITRHCASPSLSVLRPPPLPQLRRFLSPGGAGQPCLRRHRPRFFFLLSPSCSAFSRSAAAAGLAYGSPRNQDGEAVTATALGSSATMGHRRR